MLTVFYSTRQPNQKFYDHVDSKCSLDTTEIEELVNDGSTSLASAYNTAIDECQTEYLLLVHDDVILPEGFDNTIISLFEQNPEHSIIGVAGSPFISKNGIWFEQRHLMCGRVVHEHQIKKEKKRWESKYSALFPGKLMDVVIIDGLFMAIKISGIKERFQEQIEGFHYYDVAFCFKNHLAGVKIGVTSDIKIIHKSIGKLSPEWYLAREQFAEENKNTLPASIPTTPVFIKDSMRSLAYFPKVTVIIPSKNNFQYLSKCVASFFNKSAYPNYDIIIADTGSDDDTISLVEGMVSDEKHDGKVNLQRFNYYNFAKINNEVVKSLSEDTELILFCNDDIELMNDALWEMVTTHEKNKNIGTVGARLYYGNGLLQHGGIMLFVKDGRIGVSHKGIKTFYGAGWDEEQVVGNTGALMMVKKDDFQKHGGFDERTVECFEDLLFNMRLMVDGKKNIYNGNAVAFHYESISRKKNEGSLEGQTQDYNNLVLPFIENNMSSIKKYIVNADIAKK